MKSHMQKLFPKNCDERYTFLSFFNSCIVNMRQLDEVKQNSFWRKLFGRFLCQCSMHLNSVQICFWLLFDSRRIIHMNSNEILWMHSAFRKRIPPAIHMHTTASHTRPHRQSRTQNHLPKQLLHTYALIHL